MSFFTRLSNGWDIFKTSFRILKENKSLIIFPILSGCALIVVVASFVTGVFAFSGWDIDNVSTHANAWYYLLVFVFYLVNYFIIVFFNVALVHCVRLYLRHEELSLRAGIDFAASRISVIFSWAVVAATVGMILKMIQENAGTIGKIITGLIGIVWNVATFFVVPVIAYENESPIGAVKRSSQIIKDKWGESLAGNFSFGLVQLLAILLICGPLLFLGSLVNPLLGILLAVLAGFIIVSVISAAQMIFISTVYHNMVGEQTDIFDQNMIDDIFTPKKKFFN